MTKAFSLVELSIVLVILGLLVGGILAGQSLVRAGELRSVTADFNKHQTAIYAFRDKYFGLPGDITNATALWSATVNGDGNSAMGTNTNLAEGYRAWQQMGLAGLIEGQYAGTQAGYGTNVTPGVDVPQGKMSGSGYTLVNFSQFSGQNFEVGFSDLPDTRLNMILFGGKTAGFPNYGLLKPEEGWNLDTKSDDGMPAFGKIRAGSASNCTTGATSASTYYLARTTQVCLMAYLI